MCGITGLFNFQINEEIDIEYYVKKVLEERLLFHRGPDDSGYWFDSNKKILLMHNRLSIQDLSGNAKQPMESSNFRYVISYNGEIYNKNFLAQKINIVSSSSIFKSDTKLLLESIVQKGIFWTINNIVGMFSFAIWDKKEKKLYLSVDRFSEKPLYYSFKEGQLFFSSELKVFEQINWLKNLLIDKYARNAYFLLGYIPAPLTIWKNIRKLKPGTILIFDQNNNIFEELNYVVNNKDFVNNDSISQIKKENLKTSIKNALEVSIERHLICDVPSGVFLSGGTDSSLITALASKFTNNHIKTFSVGFNNKKYDESKYAKIISDYFSTEHTNIKFDESAFFENLKQLPFIFDEPFGDPAAIPTIELAKYASKKVKVILGGDGADEIFGGYGRYFSKKKQIVFNLFQALNYKSLKKFKKLFSFETKNYSSSNIYKLREIIFNNSPLLACTLLNSYWFKNMDEEFENFLLSLLTNIKKASNEKENYLFYSMEIDKSLYLPSDLLTKLDRSCMAFGLESRSPYLDKDLVNLISTIPNQKLTRANSPKFLLKEILSDYVPINSLERDKKGFTLPLREWLVSPKIKYWVDNLITKDQLELAGFDYEYIVNLWNKFCNNPKKGNIDFLWLVIVYLNWQREKIL